MKRQYREQIVILFVAAVLALNYPLLSLVDRLRLPLGVPLLYLYVFLIWLAIIVFMALITERAGVHGEDRADS